jgi:hypothetical protein
MGYDPAEALVRLGRRAEAEGDVDLAIKAAIALMSFRWPKLKETALGIGLDGSIADRLDAASARLSITVTTGIDRPPDDPGIIEAAPVPPTPADPPSAPAQPKLRLAAEAPPSAPEPPSPPVVPGKPVPAHQYWAQMAKPER